jgi:hypothetical protein
VPRLEKSTRGVSEVPARLRQLPVRFLCKAEMVGRFWFVPWCHKQKRPVFLNFPARRSFPNRIDPIAILNNSIGGDQRTAEVPGRGNDGSVRRVTDRNKRYRFE